MSQVACVIDDDAHVRMAAVLLLEEAGFAVVDFGAAEPALLYLRAHAREVSTLFTDVRLPGELSGTDLARVASEQWPWMTILVTSGSPGAGAKVPESAVFLQKPWHPTDLLALAH